MAETRTSGRPTATTGAAKGDVPPRAARGEAPAGTRLRDPLASQARLLAAAKAEFAQKGLAGARVDEIAAKAKINKRMIYHYFKSKEDLFLAVLEGAYADIRASERRLDLEHLEPKEALTRLVTFTWDYYVKNPEFLRLINSENLHKARHLKKSIKIKEMHSPFVALIEGLLRRGAEEGVFRRGIDANQLYISIAGLSYYYLTNRYTLSVIYGVDLGARPAMAKRREVVSEMVLAYVRNPAG